METALEQSVDTLGLLLLSKLNLKLRERLSPFSVLSGATLTTLNCTLVGETALTLEEELLPLSTTKSANCPTITCHASPYPYTKLKLSDYSAPPSQKRRVKTPTKTMLA
jgi:hypothetical protein